MGKKGSTIAINMPLCLPLLDYTLFFFKTGMIKTLDSRKFGDAVAISGVKKRVISSTLRNSLQF